MPKHTTAIDIWFKELTSSERRQFREAREVNIGDDRVSQEDITEAWEILLMLNTTIDLEEARTNNDPSLGYLKKLYRVFRVLYGKPRADDLTTG